MAVIFHLIASIRPLFTHIFLFFFFFNDTATTEIYTLSLHDALPICGKTQCVHSRRLLRTYSQPVSSSTSSMSRWVSSPKRWRDRKSTRLNSSHTVISYAVFCLKKKKKTKKKNPHKQKHKHLHEMKIQ